MSRTQAEYDAANAADLVAVMRTGPGRRMVIRVMEQAGLYTSGYEQTPHDMAISVGKRMTAVALRDELARVCPELLAQAERERIDGIMLARTQP